jgi:hypothetical protein
MGRACSMSGGAEEYILDFGEESRRKEAARKIKT